MDQDLQRLIQELRNEKCPGRVTKKLADRIGSQNRSVGLGTFKIAFVTAVLVVLCGLAVWRQTPTGEAARPAQPAPAATLARAQVARQAEEALGYIGGILLKTGAHTEKIVLNQAVPPLRNSFTTAKEKLLNHIEP